MIWWGPLLQGGAQLQSAAGAITGTLNVTEADDTLSSSGALAITGSLSATEASDTLSSNGAVSISGSSSITEEGDSLASSGSLAVSGSLSVTEASDSLSSTGFSESVAFVDGVSSTGSAGSVLVSIGEAAVAGSVSATGSASDVTVEVTFTYSRPDSDISIDGWTGNPDNVDLYKNIDEIEPVDSDYVESPSLEDSPGPIVFGIDQQLSSGRTYSVRTRARATGGIGYIRAILQNSSGSVVGTSSWQSLSASFTTYDLLITTTDVGDRVELEVSPTEPA